MKDKERNITTVSEENIYLLNRRYFDSSAATMEDHPSNPATIYTNPLELHTGLGRTFAVSLSASF